MFQPQTELLSQLIVVSTVIWMEKTMLSKQGRRQEGYSRLQPQGELKFGILKVSVGNFYDLFFL